MTLVPHLDLNLDLVPVFPTWVSPGSGNSGPYLGIIGNGSYAWPAGWPHLYLVSGVPTWVLPMPGDTGPHVGLTWTW